VGFGRLFFSDDLDTDIFLVFCATDAPECNIVQDYGDF